MFARTPRLLLRPGWSSDAPALARAIGDQAIVRNLASAPWPYGLAEAEQFLDRAGEPGLPNLLAFARTAGAPRLVGGAGLTRAPSGAVELGYWIARPYWGLGYATEAAAAVLDIARALGFAGLEASHFLDNPASGRVLAKLAFTPTGAIVPRLSRGRGGPAPSRHYRLRFDEQLAGGQVEQLADDKAEKAAAMRELIAA